MLNLHWTVQGGLLPLIVAAVVMFLINPLHYVATGLILWDLVRNIRFERQWFGVRVTRIVKPIAYRYLKACVIGLIASILMLAAGVTVSWQSILFVVALSFALGLIRTRFASSPFAISAAVVLAGLSHFMTQTQWPRVNSGVHFLRQFHIGAWLTIGIASCLAELSMQWWNSRGAALPAIITGKRGRHIGALKLQLGFSIPMVVWIAPLPYGTVSFAGPIHPWLFASNQMVSVVAMSVVCGIHGLFTSIKPERVLVQWRWWNAVEAALLASGFGVQHWFYPKEGFIGAAMLIVVVESARSVWRKVDASSEPAYSPSNEGVMIIYTIRGSLSETLGLKPGEVITHVNQTPVHSEYDLHFAFEQNPAYAKFQVLDERGEMRLVGNPIYEGERHQLGLLVVVSSDVPVLKLRRPLGFLETIYLRR